MAPQAPGKEWSLPPETWSKLAEDERTKLIMAPLARFFNSATSAHTKSQPTSKTGSTRTLIP